MFAFTDNTLLYCVVVFLRALTSLIANCCTMSTADYVLAVLCCIPVQVVFKALGDLVVPIKHFTDVKLTA